MAYLLLPPVLYLVAIVQTAWSDWLQIGRIVPDLFALAAAVWVIAAPGPRAFVVAGLIGLAADFCAAGPIGLGAAAFLLAGYGLGRVHAAVPIRIVPTRVLAVCAFTTAAVALLLAGQAAFGESLPPWKIAAARAAGVGLYTAMVSLPVWIVLGWMQEKPIDVLPAEHVMEHR
jgi:rod shape-determining protein MreD